ncbi:MAG TPA: amidohydrolase family protein [Thermoanaerobaculia bacterium]|nr:amidohydrolase family protein [Thermoanaerobaculia bacterium]
MSDAVVALGPDANGSCLIAENGVIAHFGPKPEHFPADALDCSGAIIQPGAVNAHTHLYSGLVPLGMPPPSPPPENFVEILERVWWRLDRALDASSLRAAARFYVAEALLAGTTLLIDHHESPELIEGSLEIIGDACEELGIRALVAYGATERNGGRDEARRGLDECRRFIAANRRSLVMGAVGLHASFTVSDDTIREAGEECRALGVPLHVHVAEDVADVVDARDRGYDGPLRRLEILGALVADSIIAHGIHLNENEIPIIDRLSLWAVQNPRSNRGNRVGYPSVLAGTSRVALGTDGYPSDMTVEAAALREEAEHAGDRRDVVERRIEGGHELASQLFGLSLAPLRAGSAADAAVISDGRVRHLIVAGRTIVRDGRLLTADIDRIHSDAAEQAARLWNRMNVEGRKQKAERKSESRKQKAEMDFAGGNGQRRDGPG